jgi:hypothetical protein
MTFQDLESVRAKKQANLGEEEGKDVDKKSAPLGGSRDDSFGRRGLISAGEGGFDISGFGGGGSVGGLRGGSGWGHGGSYGATRLRGGRG